MKNMISLLATVVLFAVGFMFTLGGFTNDARAFQGPNYLCLDNSPNGGSISGTSTTSLIKVEVKFCGSGNWIQIETPRALTTVSGCHKFSWPQSAVQDTANVDEVRVTTSGSDWFWLDQIELFDAFGRRWVSGADNTQGWCFSTNPSGGNNVNCEPDGSFVSKTWNVPSLNCN